MKRIKRLLAAALAFTLLLCGAPAAFSADGAAPAGTLLWPEGQIFPTFSAPAGPLTAFPGDLFPAHEMLALACLQGFANAVRPRAVILDGDVETWLAEYGFSYTVASRENAYETIRALCADSVSGAVLYSTALSDQYMNLASSVGNTMRAVPMTDEVYETWKAHGIDLPVLADLRDLRYEKTADIYRYFYEHYWSQCTHRVLTVQRTDLPWHIRDLASAVGGAVVYLSCDGGEETRLFKRFLNDMTPGESILFGWYAGQEKELMSAAAQCGLSCVPADFFCNLTVFAQDLAVEPPAVPKQPQLEDKIYIAYFISDGDNVQYDMHAMRSFWDQNAANRGQVAVNWTISPALADLAPGIMNYYYRGATENDCFVCGPSGMGYTVPVNTFGGTTGAQFRSGPKFRAYAELTDRYLQRTGLRVVTVWDNLSYTQRRIYTQAAPYLYGLTVHHFTDASLRRRYTDVVNDTLIQQLTPAYFAKNAEGTTPLSQIANDLNAAVDYLKYDGEVPVFVAAQASAWAFHDIGEVAALERELSACYEAIYGRDVVEFVRADHFYNLYYEAHGLPQDVKLAQGFSAAASCGDASLAADGSCAPGSVWTADAPGEQSLTFALGGEYAVSRVTLYHAGAAGFGDALNTRDFRVEISPDGETWTTAAAVSGNTKNRSDLRFSPMTGAHVRVTVTDPGGDGVARLADADIRGVADVAGVRCHQCGRLHKSGPFDVLTGLFHRLLYRLTHLFG